MCRIFLSYIIPCYNVKEYLPKCLESLSRQKINKDLEIEYILINDGSTDDTLSLLEDFKNKDNRAFVIDQKNQGVSIARNSGLKVARGEYVFFLDSDDFLTDDASQILYDVTSNTKSDIIVTNAYKVKDGSLDNIKKWNPCANLNDGIYSVEDFVRLIRVLPVSFKAYRRKLLVSYNIEFDSDLRVGEVFTFFLHALQNCKTVAISNKRIMFYLVRSNGAMRNSNIDQDYSILKTMDRMEKYASGTGALLDFRSYSSYYAAYYRIVRLFTLNKYARQSKFTPEIGRLLRVIDETKAYNRVLKAVAFEKGFQRRRLYALGQLFLPTRIYYSILSFFIRLRKNENDF